MPGSKYTGSVNAGSLKNHQNAGILKTTVKNEILIFCICRVIKIVKNAGCQSGVRHSKTPGLEYTGSANAGSLKNYQNAGILRMTVKNEISTFCIHWVIIIVNNAGYQSGDWHSHIPGPEYTGLENTGS
jgi:hypothetical protein